MGKEKYKRRIGAGWRKAVIKYICSRFDVNNKWNKAREKTNKRNSLELEANLWLCSRISGHK